MQNKYLWTVASAFKAIPIPVLEAEMFIASIDSYLDQLQAKAKYQLRISSQSKFLAKACKAITNKLQGKTGCLRRRSTTNPWCIETCLG